MKSQHRKNQQGFHTTGILLIVVVLAAIGLISWWVWKTNSGPKLNAAQKVVQSDCVKSYSDKSNKKLCDFGALFSLTNTPYTMTYKVTDSSGESTDLTVKSDGKGNISYTTSSGDIVKYNGISYVKDPTTGTWYKYPAGSSSAPAITNPADSIKPDFKSQAAKGVKYSYLGTVSCGSLTCYKYQEADPTMAGTTTSFWFDNKNYRLQGFSSKDSNGTADITMSYGSVTVTAPSSSVDIPTTQ